MKEQVMTAVRKTFRPEFLNRLDDIIVFHELNKEQLSQIVDLMVKDLQKRLAERKLSLELTKPAKNWLADAGYDPTYGARPLRRAIARHLENPLSSKILAGEFKEGETVIVDLVDDKLVFSKKSLQLSRLMLEKMMEVT
jgi:ATP-dependent Clp protease ATP-binding subunit ClpA